jgi:hypothetical protein
MRTTPLGVLLSGSELDNDELLNAAEQAGFEAMHSPTRTAC